MAAGKRISKTQCHRLGNGMSKVRVEVCMMLCAEFAAGPVRYGLMPGGGGVVAKRRVLIYTVPLPFRWRQGFSRDGQSG